TSSAVVSHQVYGLLVEVDPFHLPTGGDPGERLRVRLGVSPPRTVVIRRLGEWSSHDVGDLVERQLVGLRRLGDGGQVLVERRVAAACRQRGWRAIGGLALATSAAGL